MECITAYEVREIITSEVCFSSCRKPEEEECTDECPAYKVKLILSEMMDKEIPKIAKKD